MPRKKIIPHSHTNLRSEKRSAAVGLSRPELRTHFLKKIWRENQNTLIPQKVLCRFSVHKDPIFRNSKKIRKISANWRRAGLLGFPHKIHMLQIFPGCPSQRDSEQKIGLKKAWCSDRYWNQDFFRPPTGWGTALFGTQICVRTWEFFFSRQISRSPKKVIRSLESQRKSLFNGVIFGLGERDICPEKRETRREKKANVWSKCQILTDRKKKFL